MDFHVNAGDTDVTIYVRLRDSTTGLAKTGLAYNSTGASAYYTRPRAAATSITLATQTVTGAHSDGGFVEVDATNAKGLYRLDLPDAVCAASADYVVVSVEFDGVIEESVEILLGPRDANVSQFGGTAGTFSSGRPEVNTTHLAGTSQTARDIGASVLLSSGTGTGQISLSSGTVTVGTNSDKTGYSLTNLTVTAGTTLGAGTHTAQTGDAYAYLGTNLGSLGANATEAGGDGDHLTTLATASALSTVSSNVTTALNRIGAFTGSGVNTILGFFKALLGTTGSVPSDVGGTYDNLTDSLEAIRNHVGDGTNLTEAGGTGDHLTALATAANLATVDTVVDAILVDTGTTLPATLGTPAGASVSADIAAVKVDTAATLVDTGTTLPATLTTIEGKVDTVDTVADSIIAAITGALAEASSIPAANASMQAKINAIFTEWRNKNTQTATTKTVFADDGTTPVWTSTVSDDGTTFTKGKLT